jgi:hypothetical protein
MQVILELGDAGLVPGLRETRSQSALEIERGGGSLEVLPRRPVDVDPQQVAFAEARWSGLIEVDIAVGSVRVIEPDARAGRPGQRSDPRTRAPAMARRAMPYWRMSMARSVAGLSGRITVGRPTEVSGRSIDMVSF